MSYDDDDDDDETARALKSVEILSAAAQLYEKSHLTRIALLCGTKISPVGFELVTKHACDRRTDGRTDRRMDGQNYSSQDRSSIAASRSKNHFFYWA